MIRKFWPHLLGTAALAVMYLDRPIGLRYEHGHGRSGDWAVNGWTLGSALPMTLGVLGLAVAALGIVVQLTNKRRPPPRV